LTNKRLETARENHRKWLEKRGLTRAQIRKKRDRSLSVLKMPDLNTAKEGVAEVTNGFANAGFVNTPMANRFKERPEVRAEIEAKARRIAPAYSKGNAQYVSDGDDPRYIGKKL
jgi:hypothetical protein